MKRIVAIVSLALLLSACGGSGADATKAKITKAEFDRIQTGMTLQEVEGIIGGPGDNNGEVAVEGVTVKNYQWTGEGPTGANAQFQFDGDNKLTTKAQAMLE